MVSFETTQREGGAADAHGDGFIAGESVCNDAQRFTFDETEFEQAQTDVAPLEFGNAGANLADDDGLADTNAAQGNRFVR